MCISVLALISVPAPSIADSPTQVGRVINGTNVSLGDVSVNGRFSAVVGILVQNGASSRLCTGTLIAADWVATAGHCVAEQNDSLTAVAASSVTVLSGATSIDGGGTTLDAASVHLHPGFSWSTASWDAGLIELAQPAPQTPFALPDAARAGSYSVGNTDNVAGFGRSVARDPNSTSVLRSGRVEPVSAAECEAANPGSGEYADCTTPGAASQATCYGDSGGPLLRFDPVRGMAPVLWGITSTGPDPCDIGVSTFAPGYQTRVLAVVDWFRGRMALGTAAGRRGGSTPGGASRGDQVAVAGGGVATLRTVGGGIGIGVYRVKINRKPSARRTGTIAVTASLVGTDGIGRAELLRRSGKRWKVITRRALNFPSAGTVDKTTLRAPRCTKRKSTFQVRIRVFDAVGDQRDALTERVKICR